jgi:hypothetical protein
MENTYTYTARNAQDTSQIVTFTLHDDHLTVGLANPLEQIEATLQTENGDTATERQSVQPWIKPIAVALLERGLQPFDIGDVRATSENGRLRFVAWTRLGGLRLAPISFDIEQVDNPEATDAFVRELQTRKTSITGAEALPGILDYWASWFATSLVLIIGLLVFVGLRQRVEAAQRDEVSEETARL